MGEGFSICILGGHNSVHTRKLFQKSRDDGELDQGGDNRDGESGPTEVYFEDIMESLDGVGLDVEHE